MSTENEKTVELEPNCVVVDTHTPDRTQALHRQVVVLDRRGPAGDLASMHWPATGDVWVFRETGVPVMVTGRSGSSGKGELVHWLCLTADSRGRLVDAEWGWTRLNNWMAEHFYMPPDDVEGKQE